VLRSLSPQPPRRRIVAAVPAGYRAPAVAPIVDLLREAAAAHVAYVERALGATAEPETVPAQA